MLGKKTRFDGMGLAVVALLWPTVCLGQATLRTVFVANSVSDEITPFTIHADGTLDLVNTFATSDWPTPIAVSPDGRFLAVTHASSASVELLKVFAIAADSSLSEIASTSITDAPLAVVWLTNTAVALTESSYGGTNNVHVWELDPLGGTLTHIDQEYTGGFNTYLALRPDRAFLYAQDSYDNMIRWFSVGNDGLLKPESSISTGALFPLDMAITPDGAYLYAGCGISGDGNRVLGFSINAPTGALTPLAGSPFGSSGESPAYLATSPDGDWLFVGHGTDATVRTFAIAGGGSIAETGFFFDVGLQGTIGDVVTMSHLLFITDESTAIDGIAGLYSFEVHPDGTFTTVAPIYDTLGTRPEAMAVWIPPAIPGDMNCDGVVNNGDIPYFVAALSDPDAYVADYPGCEVMHADVDGDGSVNNADIPEFVALLTGK